MDVSSYSIVIVIIGQRGSAHEADGSTYHHRNKETLQRRGWGRGKDKIYQWKGIEDTSGSQIKNENKNNLEKKKSVTSKQGTSTTKRSK